MSKGNIDSKYKKWHSQLKSIMYKSFHRITIKPGRKSNKVNEQISKKRRIRQEINKIRTASGDDGVITTFLKKELENQITLIADQIYQEKVEKTKRRLDSMLSTRKPTNEIWKIRKSGMNKKERRLAVQDEKGKLLLDDSEIKNRYSNYYTELLKRREPTPEAKLYIDEINKLFEISMQVNSFDDDPINSKFTEKELNETIRSMKTGKSPGPDEVGNEILISAGKELRKSMLNMFNYFWLHEELPDKLYDIHIKSMYKGKRAVSDLNNQRGVFISNSILKIYENLIYKRIHPKLEENFTEMQGGARKGRNTADPLFILRSIANYYRYIDEKLYMEFLDLIKAFDKMNLKSVLVDVWRCGIRGRVWRNMYNINKRANIAIRTPMGITDTVTIGESLKQGSVLASTLAALHTDSVNKLFENTGLGVRYGKTMVNNLLFQDDILKVESNSRRLNEANRIYEVFQNNNLMKFHKSKSKIIKNKKDTKVVTLNGEEICETESYKYLGDIITGDSKYDAMIKQRKNEVTGITAELMSINKDIPPDAMYMQSVVLYMNSIILPKLINNSETWNNLTKLNQDTLQSTADTALKRLLKLPTSTPSVALRGELGILSVKAHIMMKKLMFLQRVRKMKNDSICRQIMMQQEEMPGNTRIKEVKEILNYLAIEKSLEEIEKISKAMWKTEIKRTIWEVENQILVDKNQNSTKGKYIDSKLEMKQYIEKLTHEEADIILRTRLGMIDIKVNFKNKYNNTICNLCQKENETLQHLLECQENTYQCENIENVTNNINHVFAGTDLNFLKNIAKIIIKKLCGKS